MMKIHLTQISFIVSLKNTLNTNMDFEAEDFLKDLLSKDPKVCSSLHHIWKS